MHVALQHRGFVADVYRWIDRMDAQDVMLGLERAPQLGGPFGRRAGDDDGFDGRVRERFFQVADAPGNQSIAGQDFHCRRRSGIDRERMPARRRERTGHGQAVRMISQQGEAHAATSLLERAPLLGDELHVMRDVLDNHLQELLQGARAALAVHADALQGGFRQAAQNLGELAARGVDNR